MNYVVISYRIGDIMRMESIPIPQNASEIEVKVRLDSLTQEKAPNQ